MNSHTLNTHRANRDIALESRHSWILWLVSLQLIVLYAPTLAWLWERWTMGVWHNGHSLLIAAVVLYLVHRELQKCSHLPRSSNPWGFAVLFPTLTLHMLDTGIHSQLLSAVAFFLSLPGFSLLFLGTKRTAAILFPLGMLFLTLPIPLVFTESLHLILRYIATDSATWLLHILGIPAYSRETLIELEHGTLQVADACSGFSTLYATVTVAIMTAYYCHDMLRKILVLLIAVPLAIGVNVVRVLALTLLVNAFGLDILETSAHEMSGLLTFAIALPVIFWLGQPPISAEAPQ